MKCIVNGDVALSLPFGGSTVGAHRCICGVGTRAGIRAAFPLPAGATRGLFQQMAQTTGRQRAPRLRRASDPVLRSRARRVQIHSGDAAALRQFIEFLRREGVFPQRRWHHAGSPRLSTRHRRSQPTCATSARWRRRPSPTTCRSSWVLGGSIRQRTCHAVTPLCRRCCTIYPTPGPAPASETRKAPDHGAAIVPALRALPRRDYQ